MTSVQPDARQVRAPSPPRRQTNAISWSGGLTTDAGIVLEVRQANADDEDVVDKLFRTLSEEDLRHRFLTSMKLVHGPQVRRLVSGDDRTMSLLAFADGSDQAAAMVTLAFCDDGTQCEFAIVTRPDRLSQGISWSLLEHVCRMARTAGVTLLYSIETADDVRALQLERELGCAVARCPEDPTLMLARKQLTDAA